MNRLRVAYDRTSDPQNQHAKSVPRVETGLSPAAELVYAGDVKSSAILSRYFALATTPRAAMNTVQANVRVRLEDRPLIVAAAARLRSDSRFRERLKKFLEEDASSPDLAERVARLEQQVAQLLNALNETHSQIQNPSSRLR